MAIAEIGSDGNVKKIFDLYEHYKDEISQAKRRADKRREKRGPIGLGDIIHVSSNGDLYLEVADDTHYRIDKISANWRKWKETILL